MNACIIYLFHVCLFTPADVYVRGEMSTQVSGDFSYTYRHHAVDPTVGRLELGVYVPLSKELTLRYGIEHTSFIGQADRGEERAFVGFEWRPFR